MLSPMKGVDSCGEKWLEKRVWSNSNNFGEHKKFFVKILLGLSVQYYFPMGWQEKRVSLSGKVGQRVTFLDFIACFGGKDF